MKLSSFFYYPYLSGFRLQKDVCLYGLNVSKCVQYDDFSNLGHYSLSTELNQTQSHLKNKHINKKS